METIEQMTKSLEGQLKLAQKASDDSLGSAYKNIELIKDDHPSTYAILLSALNTKDKSSIDIATLIKTAQAAENGNTDNNK